MKQRLIQILAFLRLLDENAQLSLTNIAVIVILAKMAIEPTLDYAAVAATLGVIGTYGFKRYTQRKSKPLQSAKDEEFQDVQKTISELGSDIDKLKIAQGFRFHENR